MLVACCLVCGLWSVATLKRGTVSPAVCPRLFEFVTTLTFRALRRNHMVSTAFGAIEKKKRQSETRKARRLCAVRPQPRLGRECCVRMQRVVDQCCRCGTMWTLVFSLETEGLRDESCDLCTHDYSCISTHSRAPLLWRGYL